MQRTPKEITEALKIAEILCAKAQRLYGDCDISEMLSICNLLIAEKWDERKKGKKINYWTTYITHAIKNVLNDYIKEEVKKRQFMMGLERRYPPNGD